MDELRLWNGWSHQARTLLRLCFGIAVLAGILWLTWPKTSVHAQTGGHNGYKYISTATTTMVRTGSGYLDIVSINGGTGGTITLYDIDYAGCTGTPASGKFATIEGIGNTNPTSMFYDTAVKFGICVVTGAATDLTVIFD